MCAAFRVAPEVGGVLGGGAVLQRSVPLAAHSVEARMRAAREVRWVLGDQLHAGHRWFRGEPEEGVVVVLAEMRSETDYALHHVRKVVAFFAAMRASAEGLAARGHRVEYLRIGDANNRQGLTANVEDVLQATGAQVFRYQTPDEWRLDAEFAALAASLRARGIAVEAEDTEHFLTGREDFGRHFAGKKVFILEGYYRALRKRYGVLLDGSGGPEGGEWNYDADNRKPLPKGHVAPAPQAFPRDVSGLLAEIEAAGVKTCGTCGVFDVPVTRQEGLALLADFVARALPRFGPFQDALGGEGVWLYHSGLSFVLNAKLLHPLEVIQAVEAAWRAEPDRVPLASAEGFIRQILGWREYVRGHYWTHMPGYATKNFFGHDRALPEWFWTGRTRMACVRTALDATLQHSYAHHIQRLMVTGNFMLLAGIDPDAACRTMPTADWSARNRTFRAQTTCGRWVRRAPGAPTGRTSGPGRGRVRSTACTGTFTRGTGRCSSAIRASAWCTGRGTVWRRPIGRPCSKRRRRTSTTSKRYEKSLRVVPE